MKKLHIILFLAVCSFGLKASEAIEQIQSFYKKPLSLVESLRAEQACNDYKGLVSLCSCFDPPFSKLMKQLKNDMRCVQKTMARDDEASEQLYMDLKELSSFLKKHKLIYEAIVFHNEVRKKYQVLFDMIDANQDVIAYIDEHRKFYDLPLGEDDFLRKFLKEVKVASRRVSRFEDYVHADCIDLKLQNYVYKIELIKLRNAIVFDKRYKE